MKLSLSLRLVLVSATAATGSAFVVPRGTRTRTRTRTRSSASRSSTTTSALASSSASSNANANASTHRVKKAGGGVPVIPSGDRGSFWDPASEGMRGMDGDFSLEDRLAFGTDFHLSGVGSVGSVGSRTTTTSTSATDWRLPAPVPKMLHAAQCWLEDIGDPIVPPAFCTPKAPAVATVLGRTRLIGDSAPGDIQHVVLRLPEGFRYLEGQSLSVIPPGVHPTSGKPHKPRLYSIASTRYGDLLDGTTVSLCVRRAECYDPETGIPDPSKAGVCSGFLCDALPGTKVSVAGPVGKTMLLPMDATATGTATGTADVDACNTDIIMVATGTGIAPFRSFLHRLFTEHTPANHLFNGRAWLILGVPTTSSLLYKPEFDAMQEGIQSRSSNNDDNKLRIDYAVSREMTNDRGGKLYVQDVLRENSGELFERLEGGAVVYFCGLKGMMPGILEALREVATARGLDWTETLKKYQANHQWHVEVY